MRANHPPVMDEMNRDISFKNALAVNKQTQDKKADKIHYGPKW
jgi:hypothetical protein